MSITRQSIPLLESFLNINDVFEEMDGASQLLS